MKATSLTQSLEQVLGPLQQSMPAEFRRQLAEYQVNAAFQKKLNKLAQKNNEGTLTAQEKREYRHHLSALKVMTILRAQARRTLSVTR
jgi:uncharacterized protein YnzC (UPF0291/DUF896 family)